MALGWLEKMLWFTPTHNITVASFGYDLGGSTYCGAYYLPTQVRPRHGDLVGLGLLCSVFATRQSLCCKMHMIMNWGMIYVD